MLQPACSGSFSVQPEEEGARMFRKSAAAIPATQRHIREELKLCEHRCENLKVTTQFI